MCSFDIGPAQSPRLLAQHFSYELFFVMPRLYAELFGANFEISYMSFRSMIVDDLRHSIGPSVVQSRDANFMPLNEH